MGLRNVFSTLVITMSGSVSTPMTPATPRLSSKAASTVKGLITRKEFSQLSNKNFFMILMVIGLLAYLIYRYAKQFFVTKNDARTAIVALENTINTAVDDERTRLEEHIDSRINSLLSTESTERSRAIAALQSDMRTVQRTVTDISNVLDSELLEPTDSAPASNVDRPMSIAVIESV